MEWPLGLEHGTGWCLGLAAAHSSFEIMNGLRLMCTLHSLGLVFTGYLRLQFQLKIENGRDSFFPVHTEPILPNGAALCKRSGWLMSSSGKKMGNYVNFCFNFKMELKVNLKLNKNMKKLFRLDWAIVIKTEMFHIPFNLSKVEKKKTKFSNRTCKNETLKSYPDTVL